MTVMKPCDDISWTSGALEIFEKGAFIYSLGSHIECIPHIVRRRGRRVETFQIVGETFFPILGISRALKSVWKVLWFLHIAHCCTVCRQPSPQANQMHKTNKQQILAEFLRCAHVYKHQDQLRQNVLCVTTSPPSSPHITCHTTVSSTKDIKRVNKNITRLLTVTGPCSWMGHNFSQFPR